MQPPQGKRESSTPFGREESHKDCLISPPSNRFDQSCTARQATDLNPWSADYRGLPRAGLEPEFRTIPARRPGRRY